MAIEATQLAAGGNNGTAAAYLTNSFAPSAGLILVAIYSNHATGNGATAVLSGCGISSFTVLANHSFLTSRLTFFRAMEANPVPGRLNIAFSANQGGAVWEVCEFTGVDTGGANGSGAIVQSQNGSGSAVTSGIVTLLNAFESASNAAVGLIGVADNITPSPADNFLTLGVGSSVENNRVQAQWKAGEDQTIEWTFSSVAYRAWGAELKALVEAAPPESVFAVTKKLMRPITGLISLGRIN